MKIALVILGTLIIVLCGIIFDQALTMTHTSVSMESNSKNHQSTLRLLNYGFRGKHKDEIVELGQLMEKEGSIFKVYEEQIVIDDLMFHFLDNIVTHVTALSDSNKQIELVLTPPGNAISDQTQEMLTINFFGKTKQLILPKQLYSDSGNAVAGIFFDKVSCEVPEFQSNDFNSYYDENGYSDFIIRDNDGLCKYVLAVTTSVQDACAEDECSWKNTQD